MVKDAAAGVGVVDVMVVGPGVGTGVGAGTVRTGVGTGVGCGVGTGVGEGVGCGVGTGVGTGVGIGVGAGVQHSELEHTLVEQGSLGSGVINVLLFSQLACGNGVVLQDGFTAQHSRREQGCLAHMPRYSTIKVASKSYVRYPVPD
jgi:hypothetical protein